MKAIYLATVATIAARGYMSFVETVNIKGEDGKPLRVNLSDYEADQSEKGAKRMKLHKDDAEQAAPDDQSVTLAPGVTIPPAPAAPAFTSAGDPADAPAPQPVDPVTGAAVPTVPSPGQLLTSKEGKGAKERVFVVLADGTKVVDRPGIDPTGYPDEKTAWDAIIAATPH